VDLVETFCSMHLGVNLRKAFLRGTSDVDKEQSNERKYHQVDCLVHEFCKLLRSKGVPEYTAGVHGFPDFLKISLSSCEESSKAYFQNCLEVNLHRQVGSRYFVTAANACKIFYLKDAAIQFLKYTGRDTGNKLETSVFQKLQDNVELAHLKLECLMYYHVYGDLYMLSKSSDFGLSAYFCLKLKGIVLNPDYRVFPSEIRLYENTKCNHRLNSFG